jgi:hypothetical protein
MNTHCHTLIVGVGALVSLAGCEQMNDSKGTQTPSAVRTDDTNEGTKPGSTHTARKPVPTPAGTEPDNTAKNMIDRSGDTKTPFDQSESSADIKITAEIRRAIMNDDSMSMNAQNSKIITDKSGVVTLRGVVNSEAEKNSIDAKANAVAGVTRVVNQLEVKTNSTSFVCRDCESRFLFDDLFVESPMSSSVFCIAKSQTIADAIVTRLKTKGFADNDISVLFPDTSTTRDFAHEKNTKTPKGATVGAGAGGVVGGTLGLLAGIGLLAIPGVGPLIAAGPIMASLGGIAVGATVGGITGALVGMGIPELEAKRYEGKVKDGNILISVLTEDRDEASDARSIFESEQATDVTTGSGTSKAVSTSGAAQPFRKREQPVRSSRADDCSIR